MGGEEREREREEREREREETEREREGGREGVETAVSRIASCFKVSLFSACVAVIAERQQGDRK